MSRPKRPSLSERLNAPELPEQAAEAVSSEAASFAESASPRDSVTAPSRDNAEISDSRMPEPVTPSRDGVTNEDIGRLKPRRRSPGDQTRHSYHASLYLPEEAQFALREIALVTRRPKPHDVMLEAMADLFERYNKSELAAECRQRITSRDKAKA